MNSKIQKINNQIKKLAKEVYGELGSGFDECVYQINFQSPGTDVNKETQIEIREIKI